MRGTAAEPDVTALISAWHRKAHRGFSRGLRSAGQRFWNAARRSAGQPWFTATLKLITTPGLKAAPAFTEKPISAAALSAAAQGYAMKPLSRIFPGRFQAVRRQNVRIVRVRAKTATPAPRMRTVIRGTAGKRIPETGRTRGAISWAASASRPERYKLSL